MYTFAIVFILTSLAMLRELFQMRGEKYDWFIIFLTWHDTHGNRQFEEIDGCYTTYEGALEYARDSYELRKGESFAAEICISARNIKKAKRLSTQLAKQYFPDTWSRTEFIDWMCQPAYQGNELRYLRK